MGYIAHPADYFNLRSTCATFNTQLPGKFLFVDFNHVLSCGVRQGTKFRNLGLFYAPNLSDLNRVLRLADGVPRSFVYAVFESISDSQFEYLPFFGDCIEIAIGFLSVGRNILRPCMPVIHRFRQHELESILLAAVRYGCDERSCVEFMLMGSHALERMDTKSRRNLLIHAITRSYNTVITLLQTRHPIDLNSSCEGMYILQYVCHYGSVTTFLLLVSFGACPQKVRYRTGWHPLVHAAAQRGQLCLLIALEASRADFTARNFQGETVSTVLRRLIRCETDDTRRLMLESCYFFVSYYVSYSTSSSLYTVGSARENP